MSRAALPRGDFGHESSLTGNVDFSTVTYDLLPLSISFPLGGENLPDDVDETAELTKVLSQNQFKALIQWFDDSDVCLRNGKVAENACYQLDDFQVTLPKIEVNQKLMIKIGVWKEMPSSDVPRTKLW